MLIFLFKNVKPKLVSLNHSFETRPGGRPVLMIGSRVRWVDPGGPGSTQKKSNKNFNKYNSPLLSLSRQSSFQLSIHFPAFKPLSSFPITSKHSFLIFIGRKQLHWARFWFFAPRDRTLYQRVKELTGVYIFTFLVWPFQRIDYLWHVVGYTNWSWWVHLWPVTHWWNDLQAMNADGSVAELPERTAFCLSQRESLISDWANRHSLNWE